MGEEDGKGGGLRIMLKDGGKEMLQSCRLQAKVGRVGLVIRDKGGKRSLKTRISAAE